MTRAAQPKDILARVQDLGEEALHKLAEAPGGARLLEMANQSRTRLDEIQKRLRGLDVLEERVDELEKKLEALTSKQAAPKKATPTKSAPKKSAPKKPPAS